MAGEWIKMRTNLAADPRVQVIRARLKVKDEDLIVGKLHRLWSYADEHTVDGVIPAMTPEVLDSVLRFDGLSEALIAVGWLCVTDEGVQIPRFEEHNGGSAKRRATEARRQATRRAGTSYAKRTHDVRTDGGHDDDKPPTGRVARRDETRRENCKDDSVRQSREPSQNETDRPDRPESSGSRLSEPVSEPDLSDLVERIFEITREARAPDLIGRYRRYCRTYGKQVIEEAISSTKDARLAGGIRGSVGAYLVGTIQSIVKKRKAA